jgi:hypothetical protein
MFQSIRSFCKPKVFGTSFYERTNINFNCKLKYILNIKVISAIYLDSYLHQLSKLKQFWHQTLQSGMLYNVNITMMAVLLFFGHVSLSHGGHVEFSSLTAKDFIGL